MSAPSSCPETPPAASCSLSIIVVQDSAQPLMTSDGIIFGHDDGVPDSLVMTLVVVMLDVLADGAPKVPFAERHDPTEALRFDREHETLRVGIGLSRRLHPMRTLSRDVSGSPILSILCSGTSSI